MNDARWSFGEPVVRREWLHGHVWSGFSTYVVEDSDDLLAVYLVEGSELAFPTWPFEQWIHPWYAAGHTAWSGHGKLMLHRPGDAYSVHLFWTGPDRRCVDEGRYTAEQAVAIRATGDRVVEMLNSGSLWWDESWASWAPPPTWHALALPDGWETPLLDPARGQAWPGSQRSVGKATEVGDTRQVVVLVTEMELVLATGTILIAALVVTILVFTGLGAHRRGCGVPLSVMAALAFPVTWTVWYVVDEHPYARRAKPSA